MKDDNFFCLTIFERICLFLSKLFRFLLFIYSLQYGFMHEGTENINIILFLISKIVCIILMGSYFAEHKIDEKIGYFIEQHENYNDLISKLEEKNKK